MDIEDSGDSEGQGVWWVVATSADFTFYRQVTASYRCLYLLSNSLFETAIYGRIGAITNSPTSTPTQLQPPNTVFVDDPSPGHNTI